MFPPLLDPEQEPVSKVKVPTTRVMGALEASKPCWAFRSERALAWCRWQVEGRVRHLEQGNKQTQGGGWAGGVCTPGFLRGGARKHGVRPPPLLLCLQLPFAPEKKPSSLE